jgi:hypothetical protein
MKRWPRHQQPYCHHAHCPPHIPIYSWLSFCSTPSFKALITIQNSINSPSLPEQQHNSFAQQLDSHLKILSLQEEKINEDINTQMCCCGLNFLLSLQNPVCEKTQFFVERESLFMLQPEL